MKKSRLLCRLPLTIFCLFITCTANASLINDFIDISITFDDGQSITALGVEFIDGETDGDEVINEMIVMSGTTLWVRLWTYRLDNWQQDGFVVSLANKGDAVIYPPGFELVFSDLNWSGGNKKVVDVEHWGGSNPYSASFQSLTNDSFTMLFGAPTPSNSNLMPPDRGYSIGYRIHTEFVPIPTALWLFGSGLLGLLGVARRRKV